MLLRRRENLEAYAAKRRDITEKLSFLDDYEESIIFPGQNEEYLGVQNSKSPDVIFRTVEALNRKNINEKRNTLYKMLEELERKENLLHRVFVCYESMADIFPLHYLVINKSMFQGSLSYARIATELHKGPQTIAKMRDSLIHLIGLVAESDYSDEKICEVNLEMLSELAGKDNIKKMLRVESSDRCG
jgi:hypothetical protein